MMNDDKSQGKYSLRTHSKSDTFMDDSSVGPDSLSIKNTESLCSKKESTLNCNCGYTVNEKFTRVYFLADSKEFKNRKLKVGYCPTCRTSIAILTEKRIADDHVFNDFLKGFKAQKIIKKEKKNVLFITYGQAQKIKDTWTYGVNREIKNRKGEIVEIRQYASNFHGQKELIKTVQTSVKRV